jgi:hypothetical protein
LALTSNAIAAPRMDTRTPVRRKKIGTVGGARLDLLHSPGERCYPSISGESCRVGT